MRGYKRGIRDDGNRKAGRLEPERGWSACALYPPREAARNLPWGATPGWASSLAGVRVICLLAVII